MLLAYLARCCALRASCVSSASPVLLQGAVLCVPPACPLRTHLGIREFKSSKF